MKSLAVAALSAAFLTTAAADDTDTCTLTNTQKWSHEKTNLELVRDEPFTDKAGATVYRGYKQEFLACESCGYSSTYNHSANSNTVLYNYDYAWNSHVGSREFWEDGTKGWKQDIKWYQWCPYEYEHDSWWGWTRKCVIPDDVKFLGETCNEKDQCSNGFVEGYVDTTCAAVNQDGTDLRCVLDEESNFVSPYADTCSCFGLLWCTSDDCHGNQCVLSTMDGQKHCKYADEEPIFTFYDHCSNCRASDDACTEFNGESSFDSSSFDPAAAGVAGIGAAAMLFVGARFRKLKKKPANGATELEQEKDVPPAVEMTTEREGGRRRSLGGSEASIV